mmetsp:Transcript_21334/g.43694  ORF Transcript_21334/g.43694 Transcript_21334/m.43694 type:complete len:261 (+) Transcript_21334:954-1736(+)
MDSMSLSAHMSTHGRGGSGNASGGGRKRNSVTLLATVSKSKGNYEETLRTLRYASTCKKIKTRALLANQTNRSTAAGLLNNNNEDATQQVLMEGLRLEVATLKQQLAECTQQQQQQQQQWRSGDAQSGGGGAPTPLHAAAALVEPVPGSSDLTQGGAWNHLFQNEGQLAFSDEELKTLWAMSPRNLPQTHGSSSNAASSPPTGNLSASPTPSTTSSAATRQPSAPPPSMASSDSYEAAVAAAASQLRSSGSNNSLSAPGR